MIAVLYMLVRERERKGEERDFFQSSYAQRRLQAAPECQISMSWEESNDEMIGRRCC
jgi:hypothetical protein